VIFMILKAISKMKENFAAEQAAEPEAADIVLLREIRDLLKKA